MPASDLPEPKDDGLFIPEVGEHSKAKHHFLSRYVNAFTTAMTPKKWSGLHYVDLFAGAGIERLRESRKLSWGSPLIAAQAKVPFDGLHFCDDDQRKFDALRERIKQLAPQLTIQMLKGDANRMVAEITSAIPSRSLTLAFLDPYGLHLHYETVAALAQSRCDLIIYFPDRVDALRNRKLHYHDNPDSNLDRVLGPNADWRAILTDKSPSAMVESLRRLYVKQLRKLGYKHFCYERIYAKDQPIYQLIFCSKHQLGAKIWSGVAKKKHDGQETFDFSRPG